VYAITRFAFTLCTVVEAVDSVKCRLDTDSAALLRRMLGVPCDLPPSLARLAFSLNDIYYAFITHIAHKYFNATATECERSRRRRRADTELPSTNRFKARDWAQLDRSSRRRDSETPGTGAELREDRAVKPFRRDSAGTACLYNSTRPIAWPRPTWLDRPRTCWHIAIAHITVISQS